MLSCIFQELRLKVTQPANTNRYLQSAIQHSHVLAIASPSESSHAPTRLAVLSLLHALFYKHPNNACQSTLR